MWLSFMSQKKTWKRFNELESDGKKLRNRTVFVYLSNFRPIFCIRVLQGGSKIEILQ